MFTGIIEEIGIISNINKSPAGALISVDCSKILDDIHIGDSIAINGACETVIKLRNNGFDVEASQETLNLTTLKDFKAGQEVNLERAMSAKGRFGGHIVTGHIDGTGEFRNKVNQGIADIYYFQTSENITGYMVYKGSICVDGISLTIASLQGNIFGISVIPHTVKTTVLKRLKTGMRVNLESDIFAKYIEKYLSRTSSSGINISYLQEHGFLE